jgi:hypothetical protein
MAPPLGMWNVVTNLNNGLLNITNVDAQGNVSGTIQFSQSDTYNISGTWSQNVLNFSYSFTITFGGLHIPFSVSFVGYLFEAGQPLFNATVGPTTAHWYMLAGTYQRSLFFPPHPSGWVARQQI